MSEYAKGDTPTRWKTVIYERAAGNRSGISADSANLNPDTMDEEAAGCGSDIEPDQG
jgi:hypothetical protein